MPCSLRFHFSKHLYNGSHPHASVAIVEVLLLTFVPIRPEVRLLSFFFSLELMQSDGMSGLLQWYYCSCWPSPTVKKTLRFNQKSRAGAPESILALRSLCVLTPAGDPVILVPKCLRVSLVQDCLTLLLCMISTTTPLQHPVDPHLSAGNEIFYFCFPLSTLLLPTTIFLNLQAPMTWNDWRAWPFECSCMHDSATHNSNAAHDDADINTDANVDDVEGNIL